VKTAPPALRVFPVVDHHPLPGRRTFVSSLLLFRVGNALVCFSRVSPCFRPTSIFLPSVDVSMPPPRPPTSHSSSPIFFTSISSFRAYPHLPPSTRPRPFFSTHSPVSLLSLFLQFSPVLPQPSLPSFAFFSPPAPYPGSTVPVAPGPSPPPRARPPVLEQGQSGFPFFRPNGSFAGNWIFPAHGADPHNGPVAPVGVALSWSVPPPPIAFTRNGDCRFPLFFWSHFEIVPNSRKWGFAL